MKSFHAYDSKYRKVKLSNLAKKLKNGKDCNVHTIKYQREVNC